MTPHWRWWPAALAALLSILVGCSRSSGLHHDPSLLIVGVLEEPDRLDPLLGNLAADDDAFALAFDGLVRFGRDGAIVPDLALAVPSRANGGISADGSIVTYRLRRDVRWQDGVPFTARDVVFTWRALMNPRNLVPAHGEYARIASVTAPNPWTVRVALREPYAPALALFAGGKQGAIVPAHLLEGEADLARARFDDRPIGTGPYRVTAWRRGDAIEFERSPFARVKTAFARVRLTFFPNEEALLLAVRTGEANVALGLSAQVLRQLAGSATAPHTVSTPTYVFEHLTFNVRPGSGPQSDAAVRRAFARALDVRRYARTIFFNRAGLAPLDQAPWSWARARDVEYYPYDPQRARRELLRAGYALPLSLALVSTAGNDTRRRLEIAMQSDLARAGIALSIKNVPANLMLARQSDGGILSGGRFEIALFAFAATSPDPNDERYLSSSAIPPYGVNMAGYRSAIVDRLMREAVAVYDRRARASLYARIQDRVIRDLPLYTLAWLPQSIAARGDLRGIRAVPIGSALWEVPLWRIAGN